MSGALPGRKLERALARAAERAGIPIAIESHRETAWASATFAGARHHVEASAASGDALTRWLDALDGAAIDVPGHLVAELRLCAALTSGAVTRFRLDGVTVAAD